MPAAARCARVAKHASLTLLVLMIAIVAVTRAARVQAWTDVPLIRGVVSVDRGVLVVDAQQVVPSNSWQWSYVGCSLHEPSADARPRVFQWPPVDERATFTPSGGPGRVMWIAVWPVIVLVAGSALIASVLARRWGSRPHATPLVRRWLRRIAWSLFPLALIAAAVGIASVWRTITLEAGWPPRLMTIRASAGVFEFTAHAMHAGGRSVAAIDLRESRSFGPPRFDWTWWPIRRTPASRAPGSRVIEFRVPVWFLAPTLAIGGAAGLRRFRPKPPPGLCTNCGYSLAGLPTSVCPECGTEQAPTPTNN